MLVEISSRAVRRNAGQQGGWGQLPQTRPQVTAVVVRHRRDVRRVAVSAAITWTDEGSPLRRYTEEQLLLSAW